MADLQTLPEMTDQRAQMAIRILSKAILPAFSVNPQLIPLITF